MTAPSEDAVGVARGSEFYDAVTDAVFGCLALREADALDRAQQIRMADALNECIQRMRNEYEADIAAVESRVRAEYEAALDAERDTGGVGSVIVERIRKRIVEAP